MSKPGFSRNNHRPSHGSQKGCTSSARGHPCVLATCDGAREREASKELSNLLVQALEDFPVQPHMNTTQDSNSNSFLNDGIQGELARELESLRRGSGPSSQTLSTINTDMKGVVFIKINRHDVCANELVYSIFDRVRIDKQACSRHVIRVIPLQRVFYPNDDELKENVKALIDKELLGIPSSDSVREKSESLIASRPSDDSKLVSECSPVESTRESDDLEPNKRICIREDDISSAPTIPNSEDLPTSSEGDNTSVIPVDTSSDVVPQITPPVHPSEDAAISLVPVQTNTPPLLYTVVFKRRNHNVLQRTQVQRLVAGMMPPGARIFNTNPQAAFIVEALKNICGISFSRRYVELLEFNLRKYQTLITGGSAAGGAGSKGTGGIVMASENSVGDVHGGEAEDDDSS